MTVPKNYDVFLSRFPEKHRYIDCAGQVRIFQTEVSLRDGYRFRAREVSLADHCYEFDAFSVADPLKAFAEVTTKIREALAIRYLNPNSIEPDMLTSTIVGRVTHEGFVVDGRYFTWPQITNLVQSHEGLQFRLTFADN